MIVYVDGVFDLTHNAHFKLFKKAKALGDILYVGVLSDEECKNYKRLPILTAEERKLNILNSEYVDKVIINVPNVVSKEFIKEHNIDIVAHAHKKEEDEYYDYQYKIPKEMGMFKRLDYTDGISTTDIINRILDRNK
jgi:cytidyltransferase-like protein